MTDQERAEAAFNILQKYNGLRNDLDAYLYDVAEWGKGFLENAPDPESFGIK